MSIDAPVAHPFIRLVEPAELNERVCHVCGHGPDGDKVTADGVIPGRRFAEFKVAGADPVDPGRIHTRHDEAGATVTTVRSSITGEPVAVRHEHMVVCEVCLTAVARMLGLGDLGAVQAEVDQAIERAQVVGGQNKRLEFENEALRDGIRASQVLSKVLDVERSEKPTTTRRSSRASS
jgi:hypothetical protein